MLSTLLLPTKGTVKIKTHDLRKDARKIQKIIGLVFQESILDEDLSAFDNLDIHARLYKIPKEKRHQKINDLMKLVGLNKLAANKVSTFSGGMKRKLELIRGLINEPEILFLDEPTLGLDPHARRAIWDYIRKLNKEQKVTVILTTHYMEEADILCNRVGIIHNGKLVKIDNPQKLKDSLKGDIVEVKSSKFPRKATAALKKLRYVKDVDVFDSLLRIYVLKGEEKIPKILSFMKKTKWCLRALCLRNQV